MKREWNEQSRLNAIKNGSLSVNGNYALGKVCEGTYYSPKSGDDYVLFSGFNGKLESTLHAVLPRTKCGGLVSDAKVKVRITFIYKSGGMNAELFEE